MSAVPGPVLYPSTSQRGCSVEGNTGYLVPGYGEELGRLQDMKGFGFGSVMQSERVNAMPEEGRREAPRKPHPRGEEKSTKKRRDAMYTLRRYALHLDGLLQALVLGTTYVQALCGDA